MTLTSIDLLGQVRALKICIGCFREADTRRLDTAKGPVAICSFCFPFGAEAFATLPPIQNGGDDA